MKIEIAALRADMQRIGTEEAENRTNGNEAPRQETAQMSDAILKAIEEAVRKALEEHCRRPLMGVPLATAEEAARDKRSKMSFRRSSKTSYYVMA